MYREDDLACYSNAIASIPELDSLRMTLKQQFLITESSLLKIVLGYVRRPQMDNAQIDNWAVDILNTISSARAQELHLSLDTICQD